MKRLLILATALLAFASAVGAQTRWADLTPEERTVRIEAVRNARTQKIRAERTANRQRAKAAGRIEARATRARDRALMAVWTRLTPEVRAMYAARYSVERVSRQPEWRDQTRAERIAAVTDFITNYQAIKESWQQDDMDVALAATTSGYPELSVPVLAQLADAAQSPSISEFPEAEVPDLFTINRQFNWEKPHGQWMNQMLNDIDAARAAGDAATYESLTKRYSAWAEQYLREDR